MFRPLEELSHAYFARTWPIATCENQLDVVINEGLIPILHMGTSRRPVRVRTQTGHQIPHRLPSHDPVFASRGNWGLLIELN